MGGIETIIGDVTNWRLTNWRAPWKNLICSTTMNQRKSLVKPVTWQKTCNCI